MHMEKSFRRSRAGRDKNFRLPDGSGIDRAGAQAIAQSPCPVMPGATDRTTIATRQAAGLVTARGHAPVEVHSVNGVSGPFAPPTRRERIDYAPVPRRGRGGAGQWRAPVMRRRGDGDATATRHLCPCRASIRLHARQRRRCGERRGSIAQGRSEIGHVGQGGAKRASPVIASGAKQSISRQWIASLRSQ